ncbi:MAG: hypothetical protein ACR2J3_13650 [Aridibacter sp.]
MPDLDDNYKAEDTSDKTAEEKKEERDDESGGERPSGSREMSDSTGINPDEVDEIDEDMPVMPPA